MMMLLLLVISTFSFISKKQKQSSFEKQINSTQNIYNSIYSDEGFYSVKIRNGDTIQVSLNDGKDSLFFFIPYDPNFYIQDITIDGSLVSYSSRPQSLAIEGNDSVTLTFKAKKDNIELQSNFWIIPSDFCHSPSSSVYGNHIIDIHFKDTQLCAFSPTFDSENQKFKIEAGMPFNYRDHYTSFYTINYQVPDFLNNDNTIETHSFNIGTFVKFGTSDFLKSKSDDHYDSDLLFYKRETKQKSSSYQENKCVVDPVLRCNSKSCTFDVINVDFKKCTEKGVNVLVIVIASVGSVLFIALLCLILYCVSKKNKKEDAMETVLLNNEETGNNEYTKSQN